MIKLFDIRLGKPVLNPEYNSSKTFVAIEESLGGIWLQYIYYLTSYDADSNPYINVEETLKSDVITEQLGLTLADLTFDQQSLLNEGISLATKIYVTPMVRLYKDMVLALDKVADYFNNLKVNDKNYKDFVKTLKDYKTITETYKVARKDMKEEIKNSKLRGNKKTGYDN